MRTKIAAAILLAVCASGAGAADWTIDPKISLLGESDDNHRLNPVAGEEISVTGFELDAQLSMRARTPRSDFLLVPRARVAVYPDEEDDDTEDGFLLMNWEYRGEKSVGIVNVDYAHRTVLGRFIPDSDGGGLGEPGQGSGTGITTDPTDQDDLQFRPSFTYDLTERTALVLRLGYQDVAFDEQVLDDREDFTAESAEVGVQFRTSPTARLTVRGGASRYEPEDEFVTDSHFVHVEWFNDISEVSRVFLRGGARRAKNDGAIDPDWKNGFSGGAGVQWAFEVTDLFLELNHYLDPSSTGQMVNRDQLRFRLVRRFSDRTRLRLGVRAVRDEDIDEGVDFDTRKYLASTIAYEWRFTRQFSMAVGYDYTWRDIEDDPSSAESNRVFAGVTYEPNRR